MELTQDEYAEASAIYYLTLVTLPPEMQKVLPTFDRFMSPANFTKTGEWHLNGNNYFSFQYHDWIGLSITGEQRYRILMGPNVRTMLAAYAANKLSVEVS